MPTACPLTAVAVILPELVMMLLSPEESIPVAQPPPSVVAVILPLLVRELLLPKELMPEASPLTPNFVAVMEP